MKTANPVLKSLLLNILLLACLVPSTSADLIYKSGTARSGTFITSGDVSIYWSAANLRYGYLYTDNGTLFGDITPSTYWSGSYNTHDGIRNIWDFKNAADYTFSEPGYGVVYFGETQNNSVETYRGLVLFSQGGKYGAVEPVEIFEQDGQRYLSYNIWHDTTGGSDFTSLNPTPSTLCFYANASATQDGAGTTSYYGDPGEWLMIRKSATTQGGNGFLKFALNGIDPDAVITDANLTIWQNSIQEGPLDLGIYRSSNNNWSLTSLESPIGYNQNELLNSSTVPTLGHENISFSLNTKAAGLLRDDTRGQSITIGLIPESGSNNSVYAYFEGAVTVRVRQPYLSVTFSNLAGDFDRDADVDGIDLGNFAVFYKNNQIEADLDKNTLIGPEDMELFAQNFGKSNLKS